MTIYTGQDLLVSEKTYLKRFAHILNPEHLDPGPGKKINVNFSFCSSLWYLKNVLWRPLCHINFEVLKRIVEIESYVTFFLAIFFETLRFEFWVKTPVKTDLKDSIESYETWRSFDDFINI